MREAWPGLRCLHRPAGRSGSAAAVPAGAFHRQGHHLLPHAVLAGHAEVCRHAHARQHLRARISHHLRRKDVQITRNGPLSEEVPGAGHEPGMAALLPGGQAQQPGRGRGLQRRGLRGPGQQRPGGQAGQHRQPLGRLHPEALRWPAGSGFPGHAGRLCRKLAGCRRPGRAVRAARLRQGDARHHGAGRPGEPVRRCREALGAGQGSGTDRQAA